MGIQRYRYSGWAGQHEGEMDYSHLRSALPAAVAPVHTQSVVKRGRSLSTRDRTALGLTDSQGVLLGTGNVSRYHRGSIPRSPALRARVWITSPRSITGSGPRSVVHGEGTRHETAHASVDAADPATDPTRGQ